jgi:hypothetical protein
MTSEQLAGAFAEAVIAQNRCIEKGDARAGNGYARVYATAGHRLLADGEAAIEVFSTLLSDPSSAVRAAAAAFLLKSRTEQALAALRQIAQGKGIGALEAQMTLQRYERGAGNNLMSAPQSGRLTNVAADKHFSDATSSQWWSVLAAELRR